MILKLSLSIQTICLMFTKNIDEYNPDKGNKILIVFDDMIVDMIHNKKINSIVTELFIRGRKIFLLFLLLNHTINFQTMSDSILAIFFFFAKILNKREL